MKKRAAIVVTLIVANIAGLVGWTRLAPAQEPAFTIHKVDEASFTAREPGDPFFILMIGNDGRPGLEGIRGDGIHLVGVNPAQRSATILNIPRDTWVDIPGRGAEKITRSMEFGGLQLQVQTVAGLTGVNFSFAITVGFDGFRALVDEMGGLHVNVPYRMFDRASGADFQPGRVHMMGEGALSFARNRNIPNGDISRTHHQSLIMLGALERAREVSKSPFDTMRLLAMTTRHTQFEGVGVRDLYTLIALGLSIDPANVRTVTMPSAIGKVGKADVVFAAGGSDSLFADFRDDAILQGH
ncbi:MAG TPA: LCP family protein [Acidimicrobiales bacterium]|jgi:polyisoprenyl-teichoic acid--peptidoglycan teichoic acid transferase|nr:LCP family protein [Acidimicrobiales bacterium]